MIVVDASVLVPFLIDHAAVGPLVRQRVRDERLVAPAHSKLETQSVIRRRALNGLLDVDVADQAVADLARLPMVVHPVEPLLARAWELRDAVTTYDACYVALAEVLGVVLLTGDARLANAVGPTCTIELVPQLRGTARSDDDP